MIDQCSAAEIDFGMVQVSGGGAGKNNLQAEKIVNVFQRWGKVGFFVNFVNDQAGKPFLLGLPSPSSNSSAAATMGWSQLT